MLIWGFLYNAEIAHSLYRGVAASLRLVFAEFVWEPMTSATFEDVVASMLMLLKSFKKIKKNDWIAEEDFWRDVYY